MAVTTAQIQSTGNIKVTFNASTGKILIEDISTWAATLGLTFPNDQVKGIVKAYKPGTSTAFYSNTNFSSPDFDIGAGDTSLELTFPKDVNGNYLQGNYIFVVTWQVTELYGSPVEGSVQWTMDYCPTCPTGNLLVTTDIYCSQITVTDKTNYGNYESRSRLITGKYPLSIPAKSDLTWDQNIRVITPIYSGEWLFILQVDVTYKVTDNLYFVCRVTDTKRENVEDDYALCTAYCAISKLRAQMWSNLGANGNVAEKLERKYVLASSEMINAKQAIYCGKFTEVNDYVEKIHQITGVSVDDCCCEDETSSELIIACFAAAGEKGDKGDQGDQGEKGDTGAAGADGADGADSYEVIMNTTDDSCTTNNTGSVDILKSVTLSGSPATPVLENDGDSLMIEAFWEIKPGPTGLRVFLLDINGVFIPTYFWSAAVTSAIGKNVKLTFILHREGAIAQYGDVEHKISGQTLANSWFAEDYTFNLEANMNIRAHGAVNDPGLGANDVCFRKLRISKFKI